MEVTVSSYSKHKIKVNFYRSKKGKVRSLGFKQKDGHDATVGVILPGNHNFGTAARREEIHVVSGVLFVGQHAYGPTDEPIVFKAGKKIKLSCMNPVAYLCLYGE